MICVEIFPHMGCRVNGKWIKFGQTITLLDTALQEHVCIKENGYSYLWEKSDVVCSCSTLVEDLNEMISEAKEDGTYERKKADLEMERWKAYHFISIAIGEKGHFKSYNW